MQLGIVGNGILGLSVAWELIHRLGQSDRLTIFGESARSQSGSMAAAAMLNSFAEVDSFSARLHSFHERMELSQQSASLWPRFLSGFADSERHLKYGTFLISNSRTDALEFENFRAVLEALRLWAEPHTEVNPHDIPGLKPNAGSQVVQAIHIPREGFMDPGPVLTALEDSLLADARVTLIAENVRDVVPNSDNTISVQTSPDKEFKFDKVVVAAGVLTQQILHRVWDVRQLPHILSGSGSTVRLRLASATQTEVIRTVNRGLACGIYTAPYGREIVVGATNRILDHPSDTSVEDLISILLNVTEQVSMSLAEAQITKINRGSRPVSSDGLPIVGEIHPNVFVASGTRRDGWHLAPLIAGHLAATVLGCSSEYDLSLFGTENRPYRDISIEQASKRGAREYVNAMFQHGYHEARGRYPEYLRNNYELAVLALHERLGIPYGLAPEFIGYAMKNEDQARRIWFKR